MTLWIIGALAWGLLIFAMCRIAGQSDEAIERRRRS